MARKWWTLLVVCVGSFMLLLDVTIVNVALPEIERDLGATLTDLQWVIDAYVLALAALTLIAGSLGTAWGADASSSPGSRSSRSPPSSPASPPIRSSSSWRGRFSASAARACSEQSSP
jgi:MFS family permease